MNKTIYFFYIGENDKKKLIQEKVNWINNNTDWKAILGPSKKEHEQLLKESKFYKKSFDLQIYSFCADYWRYLTIYKNGGLYIDAGCDINKNNLNKFLSDLQKYEISVVLERPWYLWSGFFYFKEANNSTLLKLVKHMDKIAIRSFNHIEIAPIFMSHFFFEYYGYNIESNKKIKVIKSVDFNNGKYFKMNPQGSWWNKVNVKMKRNYTVQEGWERSFNSFNKEISQTQLIIKRFIYSRIWIFRWLTYIYPVIKKVIK